MWDDTKFVAFDFETSGTLPEYALQPWRVPQRKAWATSLATVQKVGSEMKIGGGLAPDVGMMRAFLQEAIDKQHVLVGWNAVFDISWFIAYGLEDLVYKIKWLDGMLLWKHYFLEPEYEMDKGNKKSYGLKPCVEEHLPQFAGYADEVDFHDESPAERKKLHDYNIRDTLFTLRLARKFYNLLATERPQGLRNALIEADSLPLLAKANTQGMLVDTLSTRELSAYLTGVAAKALEALAPHGMTEKIVRSPLQLAKLMFDDWALPVLKENTGKKTGKVSRATDKETLHELSFIDDRVKLVRLYREALNNRTKFSEAPLIAADYNNDSAAHPLAIPFGTYSGRFTYASKQGRNKDERPIGFAIHQMKKGKEFRATLMAPPGYTLVEFDASGQEFRWMAIASEDETMLRLCLPGEDPHSYMGAQIRSTNYKDLIFRVKAAEADAEEARRLGKVANLSLQYRTSARKLRVVARVQYNLPMELPEAQMIHTTYQRTYPGVPKYWAKQIQLTKSQGYVETLAGRRVQVVGNWSGNFGWSMGSTAINYRIQGTGADQKYLALSVLRPYLTKIGAHFAWDLHDGIFFYVPNEKVLEASVQMKYLLDNLPYQRAWGITPPVPLPWDVKAGKSWGALQDIDKYEDALRHGDR